MVATLPSTASASTQIFSIAMCAESFVLLLLR
jgi:hypothetical protein